MNMDFREKNTKLILDYFADAKLQNKQIIEITLHEEQIQNIGYKSFIDLAQIFYLKMLTPISVDNQTTILRFQKLNLDDSFHKDKTQNDERYGIESEFFKIDKTSKFSFLYHYEHALKLVKIDEKANILNLGINKGDEFQVIKELIGDENFEKKQFVGIDHSSTAIKYAKQNFESENVNLICHDINKLDELSLPKFDLIISIGTLQSSNLNFNLKFMEIYQNYLEKDGDIILGFPNCRWIDGEMIYGAKAPNYSYPEMSLVLKDIHFCKKYLQQKKYRVAVIGKDYLFLVATKIGV